MRRRIRLYVSEYILGELTSTLVEELERSQRYAWLARQAVARIAKVV